MATTAGGNALRVLDVYTDGSIKRKPQRAAVGRPAPSGCGFVFWAPKDRVSPENWIGRWYALGDQTDNEYVEILAVHLAVEHLLDYATGHGQYASEIRIWSDCGNALSCISEARKRRGLPEEAVLRAIVSSCDALETIYSMPVTMDWVPSHNGIEGNEVANDLAKAGSAHSKRGFSGVGWSTGLGRSYEQLPVNLP